LRRHLHETRHQAWKDHMPLIMGEMP
jgi:hypothetical protein